MLIYLNIDEDLIHGALAGFSIFVLTISFAAYKRRGGRRYLLLVFAFAFLGLAQAVTMIETLFLSDALIMIPFVNLHLSHLLDFLMLLSFGLALTRDWR